MLALIPLLAFGLLFHSIRRRGHDWRSSAVIAATAWMSALVLFTELLSRQGLLRRLPLTIAWSAVVLLTAWATQRFRSEGKTKTAAEPFDTVALAYLAGTLTILALAGVDALLAVPNTVDVAVYHMPRVMMWLQNGNIDFYPTPIGRQLTLSPGLEYIQLHLCILEAGDNFANLVQWASLVLGAVAASLIAKDLGSTLRGQAAAAFLAISVPQGILTATGAKNDWAMTTWVLLAFFFALRWIRNGIGVWALLAGACSGFALLTKPTSVLWLAGLVPCCAWAAVKQGQKGVRWAAITLTACLLPMVMPAFRNFQEFHFIAGLPKQSYDGRNDLMMASHTPAKVAANLIRNLSLELVSPLPVWNRAMDRTVRLALEALNEDPNDPGALFAEMPFTQPPVHYHEAVYSNLLHLLVISFFGIVALTQRQFRRDPLFLTLLLAPLLGAILFSALFRWQIWNTRLLLPAFVLGGVGAGITIGRLAHKPLSLVTGVLVMCQALVVLLVSDARPLYKPVPLASVPREQRYFQDRMANYEAGMRVIQAIQQSGCRQVGIDVADDPFDYPFFALLGVPEGRAEVRYVGVAGEMGRIQLNRRDFQPCAIICEHCTSAGSTQGWAKLTNGWITADRPVPLEQYLASYPVMLRAGQFTLLRKLRQ